MSNPSSSSVDGPAVGIDEENLSDEEQGTITERAAMFDPHAQQQVGVTATQVDVQEDDLILSSSCHPSLNTTEDNYGNHHNSSLISPSKASFPAAATNTTTSTASSVITDDITTPRHSVTPNRTTTKINSSSTQKSPDKCINNNNNHHMADSNKNIKVGRKKSKATSEGQTYRIRTRSSLSKNVKQTVTLKSDKAVQDINSETETECDTEHDTDVNNNDESDADVESDSDSDFSYIPPPPKKKRKHPHHSSPSSLLKRTKHSTTNASDIINVDGDDDDDENLKPSSSTTNTSTSSTKDITTTITSSLRPPTTDENIDFTQLSKAQLVIKCRGYVNKLKKMSQPCKYSEFAKMNVKSLQKIYCAADLPNLIHDNETCDGAHDPSSSSTATFSSSTTTDAATATDAATVNETLNDASTSAITDTATTTPPRPTNTTAIPTIPTSKVDLIYRMIHNPRTSAFAWNYSIIRSESKTNPTILKNMCQERNIAMNKIKSTFSSPMNKAKMIVAILQHDYNTNNSLYKSFRSQMKKNLQMNQSLEMDLELEDIINNGDDDVGGGNIVNGGGGRDDNDDDSSVDGTGNDTSSGVIIEGANPVIFDLRFRELLQFKEENGHIKVSSRDENHMSLYSWISHMRRYRRNAEEAAAAAATQSQDGNENSKSTIPGCRRLNQSQIEKLDSIGFNWDLKPRTTPRKTFDEWFQLLVDFKNKHGHCDVRRLQSSDGSQYKPLAQWCREINKTYRAIKTNEENANDTAVATKPKPMRTSNSLNPNQINQLNEIGFVWKDATLSPQTFEQNLSRLLEYKERFGHANPPHTRNKDDEFYYLGNWCGHMRTSIRNYEYNKSLPSDADEKDKKRPGNFRFITDEHLVKLREIGFEWDRKKVTKDFDSWLNDLVAYKGVYGTTNVPSDENDNPYASLGDWCKKMRRAYKLKRAHEANPNDENVQNMLQKHIKINDEKIRRLREIGFDFDLHETIFEI